MNEGTKSKGPNAMEKYLASVKKSEAGGSEMNPSTQKVLLWPLPKEGKSSTKEELPKKRSSRKKLIE